jgi:hypothetical protein
MLPESDTFDFSAADAEAEAAEEKRRHALNVKFGACCYTLILECETEEAWNVLLQHWRASFNPAENSLEYDFVYRTAQADWERIRAQREYNLYRASLGTSAFNFTAEQTKIYERLLRYKNSAERCFQREFRMTEQFFKSHRPPVSKNFVPEPGPIDLAITVEDPTHPAGYRIVQIIPDCRYPEEQAKETPA